MPAKPQTSKEYFTTLTVLHGVMITVQVLFGAVAYYQVSSGQFTTSSDLVDVFIYTALGLVFAGSVASTFFIKSRLKSQRKNASLKDMLKDYRTTLLIKWALLEVPALFCLVCFLLTGAYFFIGLAGIEIMIFFFSRPTIAGTCTDLELSTSDKVLLENLNSVVTEINQRE